jgi:hypothetical protein
MKIIIGTLLRIFDLGLHETTEKNVEMTRDNFIRQTDRGMYLVQVKVLEQYATRFRSGFAWAPSTWLSLK